MSRVVKIELHERDLEGGGEEALMQLIKWLETDDNDPVNKNQEAMIQAVIVRLMKKHRRLEHVPLLKSVCDQIRALPPAVSFQPRVSMIKRCVEELIEKEFMKRSQRDRNVYVYLP